MNRTRAVWLGIAMVVLALAAYAAYTMLAGDAGDGGADVGLPGIEDGSGESGTGSSAGEGSETATPTVSDAKEGLVSEQDAYEVVDALRVAGHEPKMGTDLTFDWIGGSIDRVKVSGEFEDEGVTSFELERRDGVWAVDE